jgi:hypothetical protein
VLVSRIDAVYMIHLSTNWVQAVKARPDNWLRQNSTLGLTVEVYHLFVHQRVQGAELCTRLNQMFVDLSQSTLSILEISADFSHFSLLCREKSGLYLSASAPLCPPISIPNCSPFMTLQVSSSEFVTF